MWGSQGQADSVVSLLGFGAPVFSEIADSKQPSRKYDVNYLNTSRHKDTLARKSWQVIEGARPENQSSRPALTPAS